MAFVSWLGWFSTFDGVHDVAWAVFWGGLGSCLTYLGIVPMVFKHLNCHEKRCYRLGKHPYEMNGTTYKVCAKHHPGMDHKNPVRASDLAAHHKLRRSHRKVSP